MVGLPDDTFGLPDGFESVDVVIAVDDRIMCLLWCGGVVEILTNDRCFGDEQSRDGDAITNEIVQFN